MERIQEIFPAEVFSQPQIYNMTLIGGGTDLNDNNAFYMTEGFGGFIHNSIVVNFTAGINLTDVGATGKTQSRQISKWRFSI